MNTPSSLYPAAMRFLLLLLLLVTPGPLVWADESETRTPEQLLTEARALVEADRPRKAFGLFQMVIATEDHSPALFVEAMRCAFEGSLYKEAIKLSTAGSEALKKIKPVTGFERRIRKELKEIAVKAKRELTILKQIPKTTGYLVKYIRNWEMIPRCKELGERDYAGEGYIQSLEPKYQGRHLKVDIKATPPEWSSRLHIQERYPEQTTAEARFKRLLAQLRSHKRAYIKDAQIKRKLERLTLHERTPKLLEKPGQYVELKRIDFEWGGDARRFEYKRLGFVSIWRGLPEGETQPDHEAWWMVSVYIDGHWFDYKRTR